MSKREDIPEEWCGITQAADILKVHVTAVNDAVVRYDVPHRKIHGIRVYYKPILKLAATEVETMRRRRQETTNV